MLISEWRGRGFLSQRSICLKHKRNRFVQIRARFLKRYALGIGPGQFFDECDVAFRNAAENRSELKIHSSIIRSASVNLMLWLGRLYRKNSGS